MAGPALALPWVAPAIGEGLMWGAGALGTGLAALGIIENKDAIQNGVRDLGRSIERGVGNGIAAWSRAMSPTSVGPSPHYDQKTRRPIAVQDATRVAPRVIEPMPRQYNKLASRFYADEAPAAGGSAPSQAPAQPASSGSTTGSGTATPSPSPNNNNNSDNDKNKKPNWQDRVGNWWDKQAGKRVTGIPFRHPWATAGAVYVAQKPLKRYVWPALYNTNEFVAADEPQYMQFGKQPATPGDSLKTTANPPVQRVDSSYFANPNSQVNTAPMIEIDLDSIQ